MHGVNFNNSSDALFGDGKIIKMNDIYKLLSH